MSTLDEQAVAAPPLRTPVAVNRRRRPALPYLLLGPAIVVLAVVIGYPLVQMVVLSFQKWGLDQIFAEDPSAPFVGFDNYALILGDPAFWTVVLRTVILTTVMVAVSMVLGVLLALLMERLPTWVRGVLTFSLVLAWAVPTFVSTQIFAWMTQQNFGVLNYLLGLGQHNWYTDARQGLAVVTLIVVWGAVPFITVTTYAALTQVPAELVEAAKLDGAGARQVFFGVTLPSIRPVLVIVTALSIIWDFNVFNQIWILRNGAPPPEYQTLAIYAYTKAYQGHEYGYASAVAVISVLLLLAVTIFYLRQVFKMGEVE